MLVGMGQFGFLCILFNLYIVEEEDEGEGGS